MLEKGSPRPRIPPQTRTNKCDSLYNVHNNQQTTKMKGWYSPEPPPL